MVVKEISASYISNELLQWDNVYQEIWNLQFSIDSILVPNAFLPTKNYEGYALFLS